MKGAVLIIEDEPLLGRNMRLFLERQGYQAVLADGVAPGLKAWQDTQPDIIFVDHNLPDGTGLDIIRHVRSQDRWTKIVMITAHGGVDLAVTAMKSGADDYLTKPVSLDELVLLAGKLMQQAKMEGTFSYLRDRQTPPAGQDRIVGHSPGIAALKTKIRMLSQAENAAQTPANLPGPPVLILGETGTGKELVAQALHAAGPRASQPFVSINCATLPEQLVESELFGHEKGAFTGATDRKIGLFQAADGGTLFLDEIGELPLAQQAKLLKALQDQVIRPVGSVRDRAINVRILAATNAAIEERAQNGDFRSDLLYRLNTITLELQPLRQRGDDIILIAESLMAEFQQRYGRARLSLSAAARQALLRYPWPGNVRQLRNVMEQACLMCARDVIEESDLGLRDVPVLGLQRPAPMQPASPVLPDRSKLVDVERTLIIEALRKEGGNVSLAARQLGVSRDTMRYRMEKYALRREDYT